MKLPADIISRLRAGVLESNRVRGGYARLVLKQWTAIIFIGILLTILAAAYATQRFHYWSNIEETISSEDSTAASFDEGAVEKILKEFEEKASSTRGILNARTYVPVATSTDAEE